jgi:hypothetical protein
MALPYACDARQIQPRGVRVAAAKIEGKLDLSFGTIPFPMFFRACWWPGGMELMNASLPALGLTRCRIGPIRPSVGEDTSRVVSINADRLSVRGSLFLNSGFTRKVKFDYMVLRLVATSNVMAANSRPATAKH